MIDGLASTDGTRRSLPRRETDLPSGSVRFTSRSL
jgi:hypothetical protein